MKKEELRNNLFEKYFEVNDGIPITDLVKVMLPITETWTKLNKVVEENINDFDKFNNIEKISYITFNNKTYLIIKIDIAEYLIIDVKNKKSLTKEEDIKELQEYLFNDNLIYKNNLDYYDFYEYKGNIMDLIDFYLENKEILNIPNRLFYKITDDNAWTYLNIDFINGYNNQLGFQTPDQFLYEQLFLKPDLTPSSMQDSISRIGYAKACEMFERIKEIKIPINILPKRMYEYYLSYKNNQFLTKKKLKND